MPLVLLGIRRFKHKLRAVRMIDLPGTPYKHVKHRQLTAGGGLRTIVAIGFAQNPQLALKINNLPRRVF